MSQDRTTAPLAGLAMDPADYAPGYIKPGWVCGTDKHGRYLSWQGHDFELDGSFDAAELRAIADHMEKHHAAK